MPRAKNVPSDRDKLFPSVSRFLSGDEKDALAESGDPFDVTQVELRPKGGYNKKDDAWRLTIVNRETGEVRSLGLPANEQRNKQMGDFVTHLQKNPAVENVALFKTPDSTLKNGKTKSGAYILIKAEEHEARSASKATAPRKKRSGKKS